MDAPAAERVFRKSSSVEALNRQAQDTAIATLGIEFTELGADFVRGRMPVDARTRQPYGLLHGGASVLLAETLGSVAGGLAAAEGFGVVGLEINANHLRAVREGWVAGVARPLHIGRSTQVWDVRIADEASGKPVCVSRLTLAVIPG
ncbi:hotdog fold thioesterase [Coralloluteibacterium stylophorae]|uniref:Hotdog fold thioesterase n=1 Tax=Coralloluteibacterium stylophorae TaxID=1776034 RepID=A0A8J8AWN8_9GAMM|nr:hotdog fold thioesterase [Coralloluteibacterium stylophorae]MBS7457381.1 hotdog fold thioesterase [Coralloluteibacterium stylophorae]